MRCCIALLAAAVAVPALAQSTTPPAAYASAIAGEWGLLAELAGQDFEGEHILVTFRWVEPGKHLKVEQWSGAMGTYSFPWDFVLDPVSKTLKMYPKGASGKFAFDVTINPDGSIWNSWKGGKAERWLTRSEEGLLYGKKVLVPFDPSGKQAGRMAKLLASGRLTAGNTASPLAAHPVSIARAATDAAPYQNATGSGLGSTQVSGTPSQKSQLLPRSSETWGDLALLPGKTWFCVGYNPGQWRVRRHSTGYGSTTMPVPRVTTAQWIDDQTMQVVTQQGEERWVDRIELQSDGKFRLTTDGIPYWNSLIGFRDFDRVIFPVGKTRQNKLDSYHFLIFEKFQSHQPQISLGFTFNPNDYNMFNGSGTYCTMDEFTEANMPNIRRQFQAARVDQAEQMGIEEEGAARQAQREAEGNAMLAGMRASAMVEFARIPGVIADVQAQRQNLEDLQRATTPSEASSTAKAPLSPTSAMPQTGSNASAQAAPDVQQKTAQAYLMVGMRPREGNTRNPMCYSTPFQVSYTGTGGRAQEAAMAYRAQFEAACARLGQLYGSTNPLVQGADPGYAPPRVTSEDFQVQIP